MMHALLRAQTDARLRARRSAAPAHPATRTLSDLLARYRPPVRGPLPASAGSAEREASVRSERESSRCACGGSCPKCRAHDFDYADERSNAEHEAESDAMDGSLAPGLQDLGAGSGVSASTSEDAPVVEYSNGTTSCNRETGAMTTVINNTKCTRPCTVEHEADHRAYRGACCRAYATARSAAIAAGDTDRRNALTRRYNGWVSATSDYSECRAYRVSVACGERMQTDLGCSTLTDENRACCADVRSYLTSMRASRDSRCPGTNQDCPDFSA